VINEDNSYVPPIPFACYRSKLSMDNEKSQLETFHYSHKLSYTNSVSRAYARLTFI